MSLEPPAVLECDVGAESESRSQTRGPSVCVWLPCGADTTHHNQTSETQAQQPLNILSEISTPVFILNKIHDNFLHYPKPVWTRAKDLMQGMTLQTRLWVAQLFLPHSSPFTGLAERQSPGPGTIWGGALPPH